MVAGTPLRDQLRRAFTAQPHLGAALKPRLNKYIPHYPHPPQAAFLLCNHVREVFYGGQGGGGKSDALLMGALQYVDVPDYAALILRRTYSDLSLPGALLDRARAWLTGTDARWDDRLHTWTFPSGARLVFGFLEHEVDKYRYRSAEFQYIGFDELTDFLETMYRFLFSRLRRLAGFPVPVRMRSASNPGGVGHDWVKSRFIDTFPTARRLFIPARLADNPSLDREEYTESLMELDPIDRARILAGDWSTRPEGGRFQRDWFPLVDAAPLDRLLVVRYWDLAATDRQSARDPDYTAGLKLGWDRHGDGAFHVLDLVRTQASPAHVETLVRAVAEFDGRTVPVLIEQDPGQAGVSQVDHYARVVLPGFTVRGVKHTGDRVVRSGPTSSAAERRLIRLVRGPWVAEFLDDVSGFPVAPHDDVTTALIGAHEAITRPARRARRRRVHGVNRATTPTPLARRRDHLRRVS
jgi:predicted phage terminase large subunit-like protein